MRKFALSLVLTVALVVLPLQSPARAGTEFLVWPANYSYGSPNGTFTWNSTLFGLRFSNVLAPHFGFGANLYYGNVANLALAGAGLNGFSGNTLAGDITLRFGGSVGLIDANVFGGYQGLALNAFGSTAADRILLTTTGVRTGVEARLNFPTGLSLRGSVAILPSLNSSETLSLSSPPTSAQNNGTGNGTEYEADLAYSLPFFSVFVGYRSGNYTTNWSGSGSTSTTFNGYVLGLESSF
jgi:hypothetical protein